MLTQRSNYIPQCLADLAEARGCSKNSYVINSLIKYTVKWWFVKISLQCSHTLTVEDDAFSHKIQFVLLVQFCNFVILQFCWMGVLSLLLELHREGLAHSLQSRLVFKDPVRCVAWLCPHTRYRAIAFQNIEHKKFQCCETHIEDQGCKTCFTVYFTKKNKWKTVFNI